MVPKIDHHRDPATEVGTRSPTTYANNAVPRRLPGQCASMHPKLTTLGVNALYKVPRIWGLFRAEALLAHDAGLSVPTSVVTTANQCCLLSYQDLEEMRTCLDMRLQNLSFLRPSTNLGLIL